MILFKGVPVLMLAHSLKAARLVAFDGGGKAGWKLTADGKAIELKDGNPVWVEADGAEKTLDMSTISRLNGEARGHRERAETAEAALKAWEGLDAKTVREQLSKFKDVDLSKMVEAGKLDEVKREITGQFSKQLEEATAREKGLQDRLSAMVIGNAFNTSQFIKDRVAVPVDMLMATFANVFSVDGDKIVAKRPDGSQFYSTKRVGEVANFDETIEQLVMGHASKDAILKGSNNSGSGNQGGGGNNGNKPTYRRAEFEKLAPTEQARIAGDVSKGVATLVD